MGVQPPLFSISTSEPVSSSSLTMASCPFAAAHDSGVWPYLSYESASTLPVSSSSFTYGSSRNRASPE
ncbi:hypothetical protein V1520DRAFT_344296 [Lipomyces starkeyi]|uniref:Uncharacterized protein n=1 Tax=Lipomyces starkeyi NRRL Y-11557 TaxID=675824 RepID=A0A1E3Q8W8_LIPST|nr:hypothetical protein LIPSTDRAFT_243494 [Lipomyces starkeyi NRRL Y-11557]